MVHVSFGQSLIGPLALDVTGEFALYGRNGDFIGQAYKQDPTFSIQAHLRYPILPATTLGVSYLQTLGGRGTLGGIDLNDRINTNRYLFTAQQFLTKTVQLQGQFGQDIHVSNGPKERYRVNLRLVKLF